MGMGVAPKKKKRGGGEENLGVKKSRDLFIFLVLQTQFCARKRN